MIPAHVSQRPVAQVAIAGAQYELLMVEPPVADRQLCIDCAGPLKTAGSARCGLCSNRSRTKAIPDDFLARIQAHSQEETAHHYGVSVALIQKWCRTIGFKKPPAVKPVPEWLKVDGPNLTRAQIKQRASVGDTVLDRWIAQTGITPMPPQIKMLKRGTWKPAKHTAPIRSKAEDAAEYLRRFGPVYRCDERGAAKQGGAMWRRGSAVLTDAELIERAYANRWNPDAWKQIGMAA